MGAGAVSQAPQTVVATPSGGAPGATHIPLNTRVGGATGALIGLGATMTYPGDSGRWVAGAQRAQASGIPLINQLSLGTSQAGFPLLVLQVDPRIACI